MFLMAHGVNCVGQRFQNMVKV